MEVQQKLVGSTGDGRSRATVQAKRVAPEGPLTRRADHGSGAEDNRDVTLLTPNFFAVRALEGVEVEGEERDLLRLIRRETKGAELEDAVAQAAKMLKTSAARSIRSSEWLEVDGILHFRGKIYVPPSADIRRKIVALNHDSRVAGHPGRWKTLELVSCNYCIRKKTLALVHPGDRSIFQTLL